MKKNEASKLAILTLFVGAILIWFSLIAVFSISIIPAAIAVLFAFGVGLIVVFIANKCDK